MAFKIDHIHIKTSNPGKTARWYVDNLGAKIEAEIRNGERVSFRLDLHGLSLSVTDFIPGQKLEQRYGMEHLALGTDDLPGTIEKLKSSGVRILEERRIADGRQSCFFEGPEGTRLEVMEMGR